MKYAADTVLCIIGGLLFGIDISISNILPNPLS